VSEVVRKEYFVAQAIVPFPMQQLKALPHVIGGQ
jgi:hypothetical protein